MIHISCGLDNNYAPYCIILLYSILENNKENDITFHLLTNNMSEDNRKIIQQVVNDYGKNVLFYHVDKELFKGFPISGHINYAAYFRFLLPSVLPDLDKVLYLDCDMIVDGDLKELWNIDIENYALAGVRDSENDNIRLYNRLGYEQSLGYINSGVLLINLKEWRKDNILTTAIKALTSSPLKYQYHDQDFINEFYCDRKLLIDFKFNLMEFFLFSYNKFIISRKYFHDIERAIKKPTIIHFCGHIKPWHIEYSSPIKYIFCKYADKQQYISDIYTYQRSKKQRIKDRIGNIIYRILSRLGLPHELSIDKTSRNRYRGDIYHIEDY
ncbi:MAG: glycosyltransferase family 8 protein [Prevotella sp.]|nr:glycosyltransferase family 8 protein [Prevotella sp.]